MLLIITKMPLLFFFFILLAAAAAAADPQTSTVLPFCSTYNSSKPAFFAALNSSFASLRSLAANSSIPTITLERPYSTDIVYTLFQYRPYLSLSDRLLCLSTAVSALRSACPVSYGARVILDGCFLRYETAPFFDQSTLQGNRPFCGNRTVSYNDTAQFNSDASQLLTDLGSVAPMTQDFFFAAAKSGEVYAIAQCVGTISEASQLPI